MIVSLLFINCNKGITLVGDVDNNKFGYICGASQVAPLVKNLPAMQESQEMWIQSPSWEDSLEEIMATYSSILAWRIPWTEEPAVHRVAKSLTRLEQLSTHTQFIPRPKVLIM